MTTPAAPKNSQPAPKSRRLKAWLLAGRIFFGLVALTGVALVLTATSKPMMNAGYIVGLVGSMLLIGLLAWDQIAGGIRKVPTKAPDDFSNRKFLP